MQLSARTASEYIVLALKGMAYGLTHIIPGIGGGLILVVMGIYEQFVDVVGNFFLERHRWREFLAFLVPLGIGMVAAMLVFSRVLTALAERYPAALAFFFMGLLLGTIPSVLRLHGDMRPSAGRGAAFVIGLAVVVAFRIVQQRVGESEVGSLQGLGGIAYNAVTSFLAGGASVTPGLDGTYIWMLAGSYEHVLGAISQLTRLVIEWGILVPAGLGAVLGILAFSKGIDALFKRAPGLAHYAVLGLIIGSAYGLWPDGLGGLSPVIVALAFVAGAAAAYGLSRTSPEEPGAAETMPVL
ncbi:MAG: DUF368 domain-containing protein [Chloroflexi bacterium]|nr:DUF368 domain-containing protein [Chloroflexota bacterium]